MKTDREHKDRHSKVMLLPTALQHDLVFMTAGDRCQHLNAHFYDAGSVEGQ